MYISCTSHLPLPYSLRPKFSYDYAYDYAYGFACTLAMLPRLRKSKYTRLFAVSSIRDIEKYRDCE